MQSYQSQLGCLAHGVSVCSDGRVGLVFTFQSVATVGDVLEGFKNASPGVGVDLRRSGFEAKAKKSKSGEMGRILVTFLLLSILSR